MTEHTIQVKSTSALIKVLSGGFNLTKKEQQVLAALLHVMAELKKDTVDKDVKKELAEITNFGYQVVTNYINTLKTKKAILPDNTIHDALTSTKITIVYGTANVL